jgi:hypothetical protein
MTQKVVTNDEAVTGSTKFVLLFSVLFEGTYVTNLRGTFVENVKKVQNQPTLMRMAPVQETVRAGLRLHSAARAVLTN